MSAPLPAPALIDSIYREHHGWLLGWFLRRLSGSSQAADLAHDTFAVSYTHLTLPTKA